MRSPITLIPLLAVALSSAQTGPQCDVTKEPGVKYFDIRLPETEVPQDLTTYICQAQRIPLPMDVSYHAVAFEPLIVNKNIMHHMIVFGCTNPFSEDPHDCKDADFKCRHFLVQWSMGIPGQICSHPNTGFRLGRDSVQSLSLQIHWDNANLAPGMTDSSGVRVYYTSRLRQHDASNIQVGQNDLQIPPGVAGFAQSGSCSSNCTQKWLKEPLYLTRAHIHMHYTGDGGLLELFRDGQKIATIINVTAFDYNKPPAHYFPGPVQVLPGDSLKLTCFFNTRDGDKYRNQTIYWNEGSDGEMCYAFITYFPRVPNFDQCLQFDVYDICAPVGDLVGGCNIYGFTRAFGNVLADSILTHCGGPSRNQSLGHSLVQRDTDNIHLEGLCSRKCQQAIHQMTDHPCMENRLGLLMRRVYLPTYSIWETVRVTIDAASKYCAD